MPAYNTQPVRAIYPGDRFAFVDNGAVDTAITTSQQCSIGPIPGNNSNAINFVNTTNHDAQGQISPDDQGTSTYAPASGLLVAANTSLPYNLSGGFIRFTFTVAPTSGSLTAQR